MAMGWDTALILGGMSAAGSMAAANYTNNSNQSINAHTAAQAGEMFGQTQLFNREEAEKTRKFNAEQAQLARDASSAAALDQRRWATDEGQRNFEREMYMSNTAMQRKVDDLKLAGLNPMLAYQQGGASTPTSSSPGGSAASMAQASGAQASTGGGQVPSRLAMSPILNASAADVMRSMAQTSLVEAQKDNIQADTKAKLGLTGPTMHQTQLMERQSQDIVKKWDEVDARINHYKAQTKSEESRDWLNQMQAEVAEAVQSLTKQQEKTNKGLASLQEAQAAVAHVEAVAKKYGLDELKAGSEFWNKMNELGKDDANAGMAGKAAILLKQLFK